MWLEKQALKVNSRLNKSQAHLFKEKQKGKKLRRCMRIQEADPEIQTLDLRLLMCLQKKSGKRYYLLILLLISNI